LNEEKELIATIENIYFRCSVNETPEEIIYEQEFFKNQKVTVQFFDSISGMCVEEAYQCYFMSILKPNNITDLFYPPYFENKFNNLKHDDKKSIAKYHPDNLATIHINDKNYIRNVLLK